MKIGADIENVSYYTFKVGAAEPEALTISARYQAAADAWSPPGANRSPRGAWERRQRRPVSESLVPYQRLGFNVAAWTVLTIPNEPSHTAALFCRDTRAPHGSLAEQFPALVLTTIDDEASAIFLSSLAALTDCLLWLETHAGGHTDDDDRDGDHRRTGSGA